MNRETDFIVMPRHTGKSLQWFIDICKAVARGKKVKVVGADGTSKVYDDTNIEELAREEFDDADNRADS